VPAEPAFNAFNLMLLLKLARLLDSRLFEMRQHFGFAVSDQ